MSCYYTQRELYQRTEQVERQRRKETWPVGDWSGSQSIAARQLLRQAAPRRRGKR